MCSKCGKKGITHYIWNPRYPYRVYYDIVHSKSRCYNGRLWFGDVYDDYDYLRALKSMMRDLGKLTTPIIKDIKKILQKYVQYTEVLTQDV